MKKRGGAAAGREEGKKREKKACEARSTQGPASWALLSCLCTPQLADIILAALPGGVSGEVSTVTRQAGASLSLSVCFFISLSLTQPPLSLCVCWNPHPPSYFNTPSHLKVPLLNHRFTTFHGAWRRPGSHCARFHGHWEAPCVMWLKVSRPWAELPSFQWEAK